jgi:hypothetical protein
MLAPICLFIYNRLYETRQTVEALKKNFLAPESEIYLFSDGPKDQASAQKVNEVRDYIRTITGFKKLVIFESQVNKGLANSIIAGVSQIVEEFGKVIVLEDDLISSPNFLNFMNGALDFYQHDMNIQSINGYSLAIGEIETDVYFQVRPFPWGWATWSDRWNEEKFDKMNLKTVIETDDSILKKFKKTCGHDISKMLLDSINNKNDSWYVRWTFDHFRYNKYSVFPRYSFIQNIGLTGNGTHCKGINSYQCILAENDNFKFNFVNFQKPNKRLKNEFLKYFSLRHKLVIRIKLLPSRAGRKKLMEDIKIKIGLI